MNQESRYNALTAPAWDDIHNFNPNLLNAGLFVFGLIYPIDANASDSLASHRHPPKRQPLKITFDERSSSGQLQTLVGW
jgi:hypothetical protein